MMECKHAQELFIGYQDGDLKSAEVKNLEAHLASCQKCKTEWQDYQKTLEEVSGLFSLTPSEDFVSKVKQTIDKRSRGRFFGTSTVSGTNFAVISFILILLFLLAYMFFSTTVQVQVISTPKDNPTEDIDFPVDEDDEI